MTPAPALLALRAALDRAYPHRQRQTDGLMASPQHLAAAIAAGRPDDHDAGLAIDITADPALSLADLAEALVGDERARYVIHAGQIKSREVMPGLWRAYGGPDRHDSHLHLSIRPESRDDVSEWALPKLEARMGPLRTPVKLADLPGILSTGYRRAINPPAPESAVRCAFALMLHEHDIEGDHLRALFRYCLGNWDAPKDWPGPTWQTVPEREVAGSTTFKAVHTRPAFDTPEDGAEAWWRRLWERWPEALYLMAGVTATSDLAGDVAAKLYHPEVGLGYMTDPPGVYAVGLRRCLAVYDARWPNGFA